MHPGGSGPPRKPVPVCPIDVPQGPNSNQRSWQPAQARSARGGVQIGAQAPPNYQAPLPPPKYGLNEFHENRAVRKAMLHFAMVNPQDDSARFTVAKSDGGANDLQGTPEFNQLMFLRMMEQYRAKPTMFKADIINATCVFEKRNEQQKSRFAIEKPDGMSKSINERHTQKARRHKEHVKAAETREMKEAVEAADLAPVDLFRPLEQHVLGAPTLERFFREFSAADREHQLVAMGKSLAGNPPAQGCPENFAQALTSTVNLLDGKTRRFKLQGKGDHPEDAEVWVENCQFDTVDLGIKDE